MEDLIIKLEQICQCGVCLERLHEPKQLLCQHIFCQRCLMKTCTENRMGLMSLFCPSCRKRQPMIYRPFDVVQLESPLFVNQVLDMLMENTQRNDTEDVNGKGVGSSTAQKLINTKITSVYKTINMDTLEHMTQIRTDEFGVRDSEVQELENEVKKSKEINSQLLIDNFIMKAKLNEKEKLEYSFDNSDPTYKQTSYKELVTKTNLKESEKIYHNATLDRTSSGKNNDFYTVDKKKCSDKTESEEHYGDKNQCKDKINYRDKQQYIEKKLNKYLRKKATNYLATSIKKEDKKSETKKKPTRVANDKEFCWRCLRQGHTGVQCKEEKTVLGRHICRACDKVGHAESNCTATEKNK